MKKILIKNSIYSLIQNVVSLVLTFIAVPTFIRMLGTEAYGVFALLMVVGNLNIFVNLGLTTTLMKFIAEQGRCKDSNADILINLFLTIILLLPITILAIIFHKFVLLRLLNIPLFLVNQAKTLYILILIANLFLFVGQVFKSILDALQKIYITSIQQIVYNLLYWGLIILFLIYGFNLVGVGIAILVSALIWFILTLTVSLKEWGSLVPADLLKNFKTSAEKQISYGVKIYASGLIGFFYEPFTKILVSHFIGIKEVGFFDIALKLKGYLWGFVSKIFYPLFPFISEQQEKSTIRKYVHEIEQKTFFIIIPVIAIVVTVMYPFIKLWIGSNVEIIALATIFIVSFHLIGSTVIPNYQFLLAKNLAEKTIILQLSNVFFNTIFFLATVKFIGFYALIVSNTVAITSSFILSLYYQKKYLNSLIFDSFVQVVKLSIIFVIDLLIGYSLTFFISSDLLKILLIPVMISALSFYLYRLFNLINEKDVAMFFGFNKGIERIANYFLVKT